MDFQKGHGILSKKSTYMVIGKQDQFLTEERMAEFDGLATKLDIKPKKIVFDGKHELNLELLVKFAEE